MNKEEESRTGLNNTGVIAKCINGNYGWEARIEDDAVIANFYCPLCGRLMRGKVK